MAIKILLHCFILYFVLEIGYSEICNLPDGGGVGKCVDINKCPVAASLARRARTNMTIARHLRSLRCGARNKFQLCCTDCYTPEGRAGACVPIQECPDLMSYVNTNVNYVRNSICATGETNVCCGRVPAAPTIGNCASQFSAFPLDPATQCCGIDAFSYTRLLGYGNSARIEQYPWLVLLEYNINNKISLQCAGSLISNKYVLTAAHCVPNHKKPVNVRVGEYDITHNGQDCINVAVDVDDCNLGAISVPIKRIMMHPEYSPSLNRNDIALIELESAVEYTDFVRPICLPSTDISDLPISDLEMYVAGWGIKWNIKQNSRLKQHAKVPMVEMKDCQNIYGHNVTLWNKQLCAGGEEGKDSCNEDSGGPLMVDTNINGEMMTTLDGVVSFGPRKCGTRGVPGVYTKVWEYNTWIRRSITP